MVPKFRFSLVIAARRRETFILVVTAALVIGCDRADKIAASAAAPILEDMAVSSALDFQHNSGATGEFYMPEIMGAGIALLDYDNDDDLDVFVLQGKPLDSKNSAAGATRGHRLFRNELNPSGSLRFTDVSRAAGIADTGYGMGVAVGDIDNDGDPDLYLTHFGPNALYRNDGEGQFLKITESTTEDPGFGSSASFFDYDADGLLDLVVVNYNSFAITNNQTCRNAIGEPDYCDPLAYEPVLDKLYRNLGDGRFTDVTTETGLHEAFGTGLGVIAADLNADGAQDLYVANDKMANIYWVNDGAGRFRNEALMAGAAYNADGVSEASMGVIAGDVDGDGDEDLFMTHLTGQTNTLYLNDGSGRFRDATAQLNLGVGSLPYTGFGTVWIDYDNDSDLDLLIANGAVAAQETISNDREALFGQRNQLFRNDGSGRFVDISNSAGPPFEVSRISRGAAVGDIDNDGDLDVVISNTDGPAELLINRNDSENHWLSLKLRGVDSSRDGAGARVGLLRPSGQVIWRRAHTDGSYLSASDIRVHFGLGEDSQIAGVIVKWPSGQHEIWRDISADTRIELVEGSGEPWSG